MKALNVIADKLLGINSELQMSLQEVYITKNECGWLIGLSEKSKGDLQREEANKTATPVHS